MSPGLPDTKPMYSWPLQQTLPKLSISTLYPSFSIAPRNLPCITSNGVKLQQANRTSRAGHLFRKNVLEKSRGREKDDVIPPGGKERYRLLVWRMRNFGPGREAGQRGDGQCIVLVSFKCDQCLGFQGRTQETKNNWELEPRAQRMRGGWRGECAEITTGKCPQAPEPISRCLGGERRARQKAKFCRP